MARFAVLASGSGSNFQAIAASRHESSLLVCDRKAAPVLERAAKLGVEALYVKYPGRERAEAEAEITAALEARGVELVILAGYMRLFTEGFVERWKGRMLNIHPALLPAWPGTDSIRRSFEAGDERFGITIHEVDRGMDTGPVVLQRSFRKEPGEPLESVEARVHALEHIWYPRIAAGFLDEIEGGRRA